MKNSEHEMTKLMLETMRAQTSKHKNLIRENEEFQTTEPKTENEGDVNFEEQLDNTEKDYFEKNKESFVEKVTNDVKFDNFNIDLETQNVVLTGKLGNGIEWSYSKNGGVQLGTPVGNRYVEITKDDIITLNKLVQNYDIWKDNWNDNFLNDSTLKA
jgi:hypothetical protein